MKFSKSVAFLAALGLLAACGNREVILEGERLGVREALLATTTETAETPLDATEADRDLAISLPKTQSTASWTHVRGNAAHRTVHPALGSSLTHVWSTSIGAGDSRKHQITAEPIIADGRIYTLDARSTVKAHGLDGKTLWSADLTPASERNQDATGGGLAFDGGKLFATTGFGTVVALDPATGARLWVQKTEAAVSSAPVASEGTVYAVSRDNRAWALSASDGKIKWQVSGTPSPSGLIGGATPAIAGQSVIFPYGSSELVAVLRQSGVRVWGSILSGKRRGLVYATVSDISSDPVVDGHTIYVGNQSGRAAAISAEDGEILWTAEDGSYSPVWPAGGSVFMISDQNELVRLDAATGERVWGVELPYFTKAKVKRRKAIFAHHGPVLAGGRLIVASDDGFLRFFSPTDGDLLGTVDLPGGAASGPVVAGGTLYVVTRRGQLHAFR